MVGEDARGIGRLLLNMLCCQYVEKRACANCLVVFSEGLWAFPFSSTSHRHDCHSSGVRNSRFWDDYKSTTNFLFVLLGGGGWSPGY